MISCSCSKIWADKECTQTLVEKMSTVRPGRRCEHYGKVRSLIGKQIVSKRCGFNWPRTTSIGRLQYWLCPTFSFCYQVHNLYFLNSPAYSLELHHSQLCHSLGGQLLATHRKFDPGSGGICGGKSGTGIDFLQVLPIALCSSSSEADTIGQTVVDVPS